MLGQIKAFQPSGQALGDLLFGHAFEGAEIGQTAVDFHVLVQAALFGQVADLVEFGFVHGTAEDLDRAAVSLIDIQQNADRGGLAGSIWTQQSKDNSRAYFEGNVLYSLGLAKAFRDVIDNDSFHNSPIILINTIKV